MKLLNFINEETDNANKNQILVMIVISSLVNSLLIVFISSAAQKVTENSLQTADFIFYITAVILYAYVLRYAFFQSFDVLEEIVRKIRIRIIDKIRSINLSYIENLDRAELYSRLSEDTNAISRNNFALLEAVQAAILIVFNFVYLTWVSPILSISLVLVIFPVLLIQINNNNKKLSGKLHVAGKKESSFFYHVMELLDGFKEIKMNRHKNAELLSDIEVLSKQTEELKKDVNRQQTDAVIFFRSSFFILLATIVFVMPTVGIVDPHTVYKITIVVLLIWGPLVRIVTFLPSLSRSNVAIDNLRALESKLDIAFINNQQEHYVSAFMPVTCEFKQTIRLENVSYAYTDKYGSTSFSIGPINMEVQKGEIIFIVGGNGSGKSTLLKVITSLYAKTTGSIYLDSQKVEDSMIADYRELFSIIFTDFHLFDKLYGLGEIDERRIRELLKLMQLTDKTEYQEGRFTEQDLSTGQKKRLAFVAALLEEKPIYILDELAADQDPQFRKYFYEELLQNLKAQGKTIIAVTHDDHYFHTADRILKMEYGQLVEYS